MTVQPHVVVVTRPTEYELLLDHHGTRGAVEFFLTEREQRLEQLDRRHALQRSALAEVAAVLPDGWRRTVLDRSDLSRWIFDDDQIVVAVGQDGLVANVAKYLDGQPVIGVNPDPGGIGGALVRHAVGAVGPLLLAAHRGTRTETFGERTLVQAVTDDGVHLAALNEVYIGHPGHQSARYEICDGSGRKERQSSSGVLVGTGTGSTGWCRSVWQERRLSWPLPDVAGVGLAWFVREAWPSATTGTELTAGLLDAGQALEVRSESDHLVVFGDGIEVDRLDLRFGQRLVVARSPRTLRLL